MSAIQTRRCRIEYRWCFPVIPWYRQVIALVFGLGVITMALWALEQGTGPWVILGVFGIACLTLMLIFGIEIDRVDVSTNGVSIDFTETGGSNGDE